MTDTLFTDQSNDQIQIDPNKNYFEELVGEGKKFKDNEALAKTVMFKEAHIQKLEAENARQAAEALRLREEYNAAASLRELLDQMKNTHNQTIDTSTQPPGGDVQQPALKPDDVKNLFKQLQTEEKETVNFNQVQAKLQEKFGPSAGKILREKTVSLGLSDEFVNNLARTSPQAFFNTLGLNDRPVDENFQAPPRSGEGFAPSSGHKRTWAYYENLRKTDGRTYNDPKTQLQMMQDRSELGDAFKDGDWFQFRS